MLKNIKKKMAVPQQYSGRRFYSSFKGSNFATEREWQKRKNTILHFSECYWDGCSCTILLIHITIIMWALNVFLKVNMLKA
jgi:hypothetical protein